MLKALELVGFKSFADRTRFEFPPGITVIVGPNGSGKSNVVDAVKWVLGEQSVKSLRGQQMADVIFNGSGTRRPMNAAEITITLDNADRLLPIDTPVVHITRRVYRSGEGEYLINRQPCRLRDIRDLIAGTGLGSQAYSVIEQGKVELLLQASPRDRRVIFEEAAGISRFKARKIEALRRLERVEQNLLRLSDIVDEVDNRLRSVRMQASKARRYKEYTDRLQELRTQVALVDWSRLSEKLAGVEADLATLGAQRDAALAEAESAEARMLETDTRAAALSDEIRQTESQAGTYRERIAAAESAIEHQRARSRELEHQIARHRRHLVASSAQAGSMEAQLRETAEALSQAEQHHRLLARGAGQGERQLTELLAQLDQLRCEAQQRRGAHLDKMRAAGAMASQISGLESGAAAALAARQRDEARLAELDSNLSALAEQLEQLRRQRDQLAARMEQHNQQLAAARARLQQHRQQRELRQSELAELKGRIAALAERIAVLEELENRCEGFSPGIKEVLRLARSDPAGPFGQVRGLVADLVRVSVEAAPLIDLALGEAAAYLVVAPGRALLDYLQTQPCPLPGRVGFLWLPADSQPASETRGELEGQPGVLGRADRFVETEPEFEPLVARLLGRTWIVEKLSQAVPLAESTRNTCNFLTLAGELLAADGTLVVGPRHSSLGLISRRSQRRALCAQRAGLENDLEKLQTSILLLDQKIAQDLQQVQSAELQSQQAAESLGQQAHQITAAQERCAQLHHQRAALDGQLQAAVAQHDQALRALAEARENHKRCELTIAEMEAELATLGQKIERLEADCQLQARQSTEARVELAKSEERLRNLRARMHQLDQARQQSHQAVADSREELAQAIARAEQSQRDILHLESQIAELYLAKETFAARILELADRREALHAERAALAADAQRARARLRKLEEKIHARQLDANELRLQRGGLEARFREDYQIELSSLQQVPPDQSQPPQAQVQQEIDDLRQKIASLGNVNLEALEELQQLEARYAGLSAQHKDLTDAKNALVRIIERINADSRRLFSDTLQAVREHFGTLFRDLFGGGQADIVLEPGVDLLESGIEIVARPPGKEPRSISLLSGGEKTLTCAALLLAIFRSRPSPFCILDEVDAALDEANIDRFIKVLKDFLAWTQFIIVTHSKKTMTCATTIYGVTMQESGVSKQVSVRFEDVSEDGQIRLAPLPDEPSQPAVQQGRSQAA
ncbi:MAG: chromosome segregation protein SMC [Thermoguttaceae bacterium]